MLGVLVRARVPQGIAVGLTCLLDIGLVVGFDKHPRGSFNEDPANLGLGQWYGESDDLNIDDSQLWSLWVGFDWY